MKPTVQSADLSAPVILAEISPGRFTLIDGHHRVERANREGKSTIPAYRVRAEQHMAFFTLEKGYETYVGYWNEKVKEAGNSLRVQDLMSG